VNDEKPRSSVMPRALLWGCLSRAAVERVLDSAATANGWGRGRTGAVCFWACDTCALPGTAIYASVPAEYLCDSPRLVLPLRMVGGEVDGDREEAQQSSGCVSGEASAASFVQHSDQWQPSICVPINVTKHSNIDVEHARFCTRSVCHLRALARSDLAMLLAG